MATYFVIFENNLPVKVSQYYHEGSLPIQLYNCGKITGNTPYLMKWWHTDHSFTWNICYPQKYEFLSRRYFRPNLNLTHSRNDFELSEHPLILDKYKSDGWWVSPTFENQYYGLFKGSALPKEQLLEISLDRNTLFEKRKNIPFYTVIKPIHVIYTCESEGKFYLVKEGNRMTVLYTNNFNQSLSEGWNIFDEPIIPL
jgi:hypothetical protein